MASVDGVPSPESTVTTLLASSGRLRSSLHPEPLHTIKYKDRHYESASDALDAYIADFQSSVTSVGELELPKEQITPHVLRTGYRNRDVLKESLTDQELDFLKLPTASKRRESDHLSMTTDDLLLLPVDGSLPVTRTSAFLSRLESSRLGISASSSVWSRPRPAEGPNKSSNSSASRTLCVDDLQIGNLKLNHASLHSDSFMSTKTITHGSSSHHLPRWMTSHKSEMEFSGLTSIPDLKYPAWLEEYDCNVRSRNVPAWVNKLERKTFDSHEELNGQENLIEQTGDNTKPFRGDKIGSLIQRAEDVLKSPSLGFYGSDKEHHDSPGTTEELLEAERSWENPPVTFKSPVPVGCTDDQIPAGEFQTDTKEKSLGSFSSGYSSRKHPGPVEALKQMLFSLQAVEQKVTQQKDEIEDITIRPVSNPLIQTENQDNDKVPQPDIEDYDLIPGGQSLKRALHHLGRLKNLVDDMNDRRSLEWKEGGV
ncbi:lung adenoma susceptibility protein 2 [Tachysurus vachellii]|uniref:lung adenoma susceptibility protein 2 n=1 Tax=Tachysurus vachellii TaxID=175792 RepID=UPI00296B43FA|nr:lung adenoma susceptibility protein 2 [Tachysurus vachellii]